MKGFAKTALGSIPGALGSIPGALGSVTTGAPYTKGAAVDDIEKNKNAISDKICEQITTIFTARSSEFVDIVKQIISSEFDKMTDGSVQNLLVTKMDSVLEKAIHKIEGEINNNQGKFGLKMKEQVGNITETIINKTLGKSVSDAVAVVSNSAEEELKHICSNNSNKGQSGGNMELYELEKLLRLQALMRMKQQNTQQNMRCDMMNPLEENRIVIIPNDLENQHPLFSNTPEPQVKINVKKLKNSYSPRTKKNKKSIRTFRKMNKSKRNQKK